MTTHLKFTIISVLLLISFSTYSQVPDSIYYYRLFYACKAWGHAKYYHTETANGNVDWDNELLNAVSGIRNAPDNASFNDTLLLMLNNAGAMGTSSVVLPDIPDSLNNNTDYAWIQNSIFSDQVRAILDTIRSRFRPQSNIYVDEAWSGGNPTFDTDDIYYSESSYPDQGKRVLALFRYWNIVNYFYPYKNIMDQNWDTTLVEFIPQIIEAPENLSYHLVFKRLTTRINDSHAFYYSSTYTSWLGGNHPPFLARFIENEMVITKVLSQITTVKVGDIIKEIDGENIYNLRDSLREYAHGSNDVVIEREINNIIMRGPFGSFPIVVDDGSTIHTESLNRNSYYENQLNNNASPIWKDTTVNGNCNFGIVDMGRLEVSDIENMFDDLWDTDAIIFDLRNYPNATLWDIVDYLYPSNIHIANFTVPDIRYPGRLYWSPEYIGYGTSNPYSGRLIILMDERTQSMAEYTCMGFEQFPDAIKIGSTTAAADGNVAAIYLPGKITTYATFLGTFYPDYTQTQRVGIIPDYEVHPTISGVRAGNDEIMKFALNCNLVEVKENAIADIIKLFPNPAKNEIRYDCAGANPSLIELFDMQGHKVRALNVHSPSGRLDISDLNKGVYLVKINIGMREVTKLMVKM